MSTGTQVAGVKERICGLLGRDGVPLVEPQADTLHVKVDPRTVRKTAAALVSELGARFLVTVGTDRRPLAGDFGIVHLFSLDPEGLFVALDCGVDSADARIDSITPVVPAAAWSEREFRDAVGVVPEGHPDPRRLMLADDWPEGLYPLRRDVPCDVRPPAAEGVRPERRPPPAGCLGDRGRSLLPGPGGAVLLAAVRGRRADRRLRLPGLLQPPRHREARATASLTYDQIPFLAERICGICGFIHSTCYCQAVEKAAGIEVPRRGRYLRTIMLELERIHSPPAVAGHRRPHPGLRRRADAGLAHPRARDVAVRGDQRQPQDLRHEHGGRAAPRPDRRDEAADPARRSRPSRRRASPCARRSWATRH